MVVVDSNIIALEKSKKCSLANVVQHRRAEEREVRVNRYPWSRLAAKGNGAKRRRAWRLRSLSM